MPIKIPNDLPAFQTLEDENIFVIGNERALHQDIRALKIAIVNLMPDKISTETQLLRLTAPATCKNAPVRSCASAASRARSRSC